jgi:molybdate transport system substrate-binding protein
MTSMKTLAIACLLLCSAGLAQAQDLTVSAAASLTDAFNDVKKAYEQINPGVTVYMNYASSGALYRQIAQGAPADVYASANPKWMNQAVAKGFTVQGTKRTFARNALVLIIPADNPAGIESVNDLQSNRASRIGIGTPETVPAGQYAKESLQGLTIYESLASKYIFGEDVRQVLDYTRRGEVDAAFVYATDSRITHCFRI